MIYWGPVARAEANCTSAGAPPKVYPLPSVGGGFTRWPRIGKRIVDHLSDVMKRGY